MHIASRPRLSLNLRGRLFFLDEPVVMGILNATPDSFYTGSRTAAVHEAVERAAHMLEEGATFLDVGGQSTRPGSERITAEEETNRVVPVIQGILERFPDALVSVDTYYAAVAEAAVKAGAVLVNDISAGSMDPALWPTVARLGVPYVLMHMQGEPGTMHLDPHYTDVTAEVIRFFSEKVRALREQKVQDVVLDPGYGFGKNLDHNYTLLRHQDELLLFGLPLLAGVSRKKMIQAAVGTDAAGALNGTTAAHMAALLAGASILRTHDVREAAECIRIFLQLERH